MKLCKSTLFRSGPSLITAALAIMAIASGSASAAFVYHDSATTTGGAFSGSFGIGNLKNGTHTSATDTEDAGANSESYATTSGATFPVTITLDFTSAVSLDAFHLWNHSNNGGAGAPAAGVKDFSLTFFDGAGGTGSQIGAAYSSTASAAPATGNYAAQTFNFGSTYSGVSSVEFVIANRISGSGFVAAREIGFNQVPEPSSVLLGGLGLLALLRRRR